MSQISENNKRIAKNTLLLYFRMLLTMGVALYTSRLILNILGVEDFGIYNVVGGVVILFTFLNASMAGATQRFLTFELGKKDIQKLKKIFSTSISIHGLISIFIIILGETIGLWFTKTQLVLPPERMEAALWVYQLSILSCVIMVMSVPYNAVIIAHEKMKAFAYISMIEAILKLLIVYLLTIGTFDKLKLYALLMFSVQLILRLFYRTYSRKQFQEAKYRFVWDKNLFKEMSSFAGWSLFGNTAGIAYTQGVNILLNLFFGPTVNAARGIGVQVQNAINSFSTNFQMALNPQIIKSYAVNDLNYMHNLIYRSSKFSFFLLLFLSLPVLIETGTFLQLWLKTVPQHTIHFVRIILCIVWVDAIANPLITAANSTGKIRVYQSVVGGILLMILPFSYLFLKLGFPPETVFFVHLFMVIIAQIVRLVMLRPMIKLSLKDYFIKVIAKIIIVLIFSLLLPVILKFILPENIPLSFLIICFSCIISVISAVYIFGFTPQERAFVKTKLQNIFSKSKKVNK